jgi:hypothetical protein
MSDVKTSRLAAAIALLAGVTLGGCDASRDGGDFPTPPPENFVALFAPTAAIPILPFPTDLFFSGTTDLTLNIPATALVPPFILTGPSLNTLDGFSTTAPITTTFNLPIGPQSLGASSVRLIEVYLSNTTKGPAQGAELPEGVLSPVRRVLAFGTDYTVDVSPDIDSAGKVLRITPLKPLTPSTGATNIGYIVLVTDSLQDVLGRPAQPSELYGAFKLAPNDCNTFPAGSSANGLCRLTKAHLAIGQAVGVSPASVVLSWSFSTQSINDTFVVLDQTVPAQPIGAVPTGLSTAQVDPRLAGTANVYVGNLQLPYYSATPATANDRSFLSSFWLAAGPSPVPGIDPASRFLTRFNPLPAKRSDVTVPLLVTVPNATANSGNGCPKPEAGWPVAVVQHGLQGDRTQALAMADAFSAACFIVVGMDLPMHGITDTTSPLFQAANERTFNVDLLNNANPAVNVPDGVIDPSGIHFVPTFLGNPLAARDIFLRQGEVDLGVLAKSLPNLDVTGDGVGDIDADRVHYVGLSLGGIVGVAQSKYSTAYRTATAAAAGGPISLIALESPTFGPITQAGLGRNFPPNSMLFNNYLREAQTLIDSGDPANHICNCATANPLHLIKVNGDTVVQNSATDYLIRAASVEQVSSGTVAVAPGAPVYVAFTKGSHGSLFDPTASPAATVEMQRQSVLFAASAVAPGGPFLTVTDTTVVEQ